MFPGESRRGSQYPKRFSWEDDLLQQLFYRKPGSGGNYPLGGCTAFRSVPIPSTETSTTSSATSGPTPAGVPVAITSPGTSVIMREIQRTRKGTGKVINEVRADCRCTPLTCVSTSTSCGSSSVSICGPTGQNVSKPFPRVHCPSLFWRSRAVRSFKQV